MSMRMRLFLVGLVVFVSSAVLYAANGTNDEKKATPPPPECQSGPCCANGKWLAAGSACTSGKDSLGCTDDVCTADHRCEHPLQSNSCLIGGRCVSKGTKNPSNACESCRPESSDSSWSAVSDGATCNDGDACTQKDVCRSGQCRGENPVVCEAKDQCHDKGVCNPKTGSCSTPQKKNGTACDDGDACTQKDSCRSGQCRGEDPIVCEASDQCHDKGVCNPKTGSCSNPQKKNGSSCDDRDACTRKDVCRSGECRGEDPVECEAMDQCHKPGVCDPKNGTCSNPPERDGLACNDGDKCTRKDSCRNGTCTGEDPLVCEASDQCHDAGQCNPKTGTCSNPNKKDGSTCDDENACTQKDVCRSGACRGENPVVCAVLDQCHDLGTCDPGTGACTNPEKKSGTACNDGDKCTRKDTCQGGRCVGENPVECRAKDQCHDAGVCDSGTGRCSDPAKPDETACDDGNLCTQRDVCRKGACRGLEPLACYPMDDCHVTGVCNPKSGQCSQPIKANGSACDDADACTQRDVCQQGSCKGTDPVICKAKDQCHVTGSCDPQTGRCSDPPAKDGKACNDNSRCTKGDWCQMGDCVGREEVVCTAQSQCHEIGVCDPRTGTCDQPLRAKGASCDDGVFCTEGDYCDNGQCIPGGPRNCSRAVSEPACQSPYCNEEENVCEAKPVNEGLACEDDGNKCSADVCKAGACTHPPLLEECEGYCGMSPSGCRDCGGCPLGSICGKDRRCLAFAEFVRVEAGNFLMGSPETEPGRDADPAVERQREISLTLDFEIQATEVTQEQFKELMGYSSSFFEDCGGACPAEMVSWHEALYFANELSKKAHLPECFQCEGNPPEVLCHLSEKYAKPQDCEGYRLPTEAEWEFAVRAGTEEAFYSGEIREVGCGLEPNMEKIGWYCGNAENKTHPIKKKKPNALGLYDVAGNVSEWVWDWYAPYGSGSEADPTGTAIGDGRVARGGSYQYYSRYGRSANRRHFYPGSHNAYLGFRLARSAKRTIK